MKQQSGFTIIETLVYLALFGLVMTGIIVAAYNMFELSGRTQTTAMLTAEGNFLLGKINWAMSGVQTICLPIVGTPGSNLVVRKWDTASGDPIRLNLTSGAATIQKVPFAPGNTCNTIAGAVYTLNNSVVNVDSLTFDHQGNAGNPEWVMATVVLSTKTPNGQTLSQTFTTTKYLRK